MKILHVLPNYYPSIGGTQILYKGISENCVKEYGDEVHVYTVNSFYGSHSNQFKKIEIAEEEINGVKVHRFPFFRRHRFCFKIINIFLFKVTGKFSLTFQKYITGPWSPSLKKAVNSTDADVISASSSGYMYMQYPLFRHRLKNPKPFVYQGAIHFAEDTHGQVISDETLQAIKASEYYMCNTAYEKNRLVNLGVPEDMIVVVGVAADIDTFINGNPKFFRQQFNLDNEDILVGYVGRLEKTKSINILIDAFVEASVNNPKLKLVIGGFETSYVKDLKLQVNNYGSEIANKIFFQLNLQMQEKIDLFHALDIFVLPSINESFGIVFLEAWSCKKPVIGAAIGAIESVISDGIDGLLMKPLDKNSLVEKIDILSNNEEMRYTLGNNGFTKTLTHFTWEAVTKKYRETYQKAINKFNHV
jgi:glycosyltransferase involved in cell wall biosynthesis